LLARTWQWRNLQFHSLPSSQSQQIRLRQARVYAPCVFSVHFFFFLSFYCPQVNERMCRFWVHPSNWWVVLKSTHLLVAFLLKIWMLSNWFHHAFISFFSFFGLSLAFF
jgi:hypothetical protein